MNQIALKIQFVQRGVGSEDKAKQLRLAGRGKRQHKVSEEEKEILWKSEKLGGNNPESLIQTD